MKKLPFILILFISFCALGQVEPVGVSADHYLNTFLSTDDQHHSADLSFDSFLKKLEKKHASIKREKDFVRFVFSKTHQEFLKSYVPYASFRSLFKDGAYNCLTGTILYSIILNHFGISHEVIETNYHIFVTVNTKQGKLLLEATDPVGGFVETESDIEKRIASYKQNSLLTSGSHSTYYQFNFDLFNFVSMEGLHGLLFYNKAVDAFNHQQLEESVQYLLKAHELYTSSRIDEFSLILVQAVKLQPDWGNDTKDKCLQLIYTISQKNAGPVASLNSF